MILACPSCGASFRIDADKLGARGRTVRCSKCKHTWHATPDDDRTEDTAASEQAADRQPEAPNPAPDGGPAPIGGEGPEPGDERVLRTHDPSGVARGGLRHLPPVRARECPVRRRVAAQSGSTGIDGAEVASRVQALGAMTV